ncbi:MAG TPA: tetratricopeptide repeat protein [Verrucomicrobiae bacterium]|nr:tetratricopeptide repeat protein [Verrucomicrobiae bacterium]
MTNGRSSDDAPPRQSAASGRAANKRPAHNTWLLALLLALVTFVAYEPAMRAGFIWDDDAHVTGNVNLRSAHGLYRIWSAPAASQQYYPLQLTAYWMEYHLWSLQPFGYHLVNVLVHTLNALLLWETLRRLNLSGAWVAAAIFGVHPVQVESVAWISELKNLLSMMFFLLALLAYLRFRPLPATNQPGPERRRFYALSMVLFLCALLSKTVACSLPAVLLLLIWWKDGRVSKLDLAALGPMFLLGAGLGLMTAWLEKHHVGASGTEWSLSILQRCLLAGRALWFYAGKLIWPHPLIFIYPRWGIDPRAWWQYLFPVAALAMLAALWSMRLRIGRGPVAAALCLGVILAPALGFVDVFPFRYSYVADHFQYLASAVLIAVVAHAGAVLAGRRGEGGRRAGVAVVVTALAALGMATWKQTHAYRNGRTIWEDTLSRNPSAWLAHNNLGNILAHEGKLDDAIVHFEQALQLKPDYAEAHGNLGNALYREGRIEEAIAHYEQALRIRPDYAEAHSNLGFALARLGRLPEAIEHFEQAVRVAPDYAMGQYNLGIALGQAGRLGEGIAHLQEALRIRPDFTQARGALAQMQAQMQGGQ